LTLKWVKKRPFFVIQQEYTEGSLWNPNFCFSLQIWN
jgi:hypothetical protein